MTHGLDFIRRTGAVVRPAGIDEAFQIVVVNIKSFGLIIWTFVPVDIQPFKRIKNNVNGFLGRALGVGVFDTQDKFSFHAAGVQPVEDGGARIADMHETGGAGGKSGHNRMIFYFRIHFRIRLYLSYNY